MKSTLTIIKLYQKTLSPVLAVMLGVSSGCRFYPTCSEYTYQAVHKFGTRRGLAKGLLRVLRCNPLFKGGVDSI